MKKDFGAVGGRYFDNVHSTLGSFFYTKIYAIEIILVLSIPLATLNEFLDKAPRLNISNIIWILSSDTLIPFVCPRPAKPTWYRVGLALVLIAL